MPEQPLSHIPFRKGLYPFSPHSPFPAKGESTPDKHPPDTLPPVRTAPAKPHGIPSSHRAHLWGTGIHPPTTGRHGTRIPQGTADAGRRPVPRPPALATWELIRNGSAALTPSSRTKGRGASPGRASVIAAPYYQGRVLPAESKIFQYPHRAGKRARCNGKVQQPGTRCAQVPDGRQPPGSPCGEHQGQLHPPAGGGAMPDP